VDKDGRISAYSTEDMCKWIPRNFFL